MVMEVLSEVGVQSRLGFLNDHFNISRRKSLYSRTEVFKVMGRQKNLEGKEKLRKRRKPRQSGVDKSSVHFPIQFIIK